MTDDRPRDDATVPTPEASTPRRARSRAHRWTIRAIKVFAAVVVVWLMLAYVVLPLMWRHYEHQPGMVDAPKTTVTALGFAGDPLNVGLIGSEREIVEAMTLAGWDPADPVTLRTSLAIASSVIRDRPYPDAPVSPLYVFGRMQDLAFQKPVGESARQRHHVRFWKSTDLGRDGEPLWIGAVTFDQSVGFSRWTGQITHHIAPDVDAERDGLIGDLRRVRRLSRLYQVTGVGATVLGRNGGGDLYFTDGELTIGVLTSSAAAEPAEVLENPPIVRFKDQLWDAVKPLFDAGAAAVAPGGRR